jgi:ParB/RepB/Spo0J family partition protein
MNERKQEKRGLGRGLAALMSDVGVDVHSAGQTTGEDGRKGLREIPIDTIEPNPEQPRRDFDAASLEELSESIRLKGVLQPLVVRPFGPHPGKYQIVAGERRWRAAQLAGLHAVPALVRVLNDSEVLEIAIIENIQREDLNPLEEAIGYRNLIERFGHTQEQVASALGKSRSHIANLLRLLKPAGGGAGTPARGKAVSGTCARLDHLRRPGRVGTQSDSARPFGTRNRGSGAPIGPTGRREETTIFGQGCRHAGSGTGHLGQSRDGGHD